jgi:pyruvate kinase
MPNSLHERRTRIVSTVGPATVAPGVLEAVLAAGTDVVRLNFSHGTHDGHGRVIDEVRRIAAGLGRPVAVLQDLAGPRVRVGVVSGGEVTLERGRKLVLTTRAVEGTSEVVSITHRGLPADVKPGDSIFLSDGTIELAVEEVTREDVVCRIVVGGPLGSHKGMNVPGRALRVSALTDQDRRDLAFGVGRGVDYVGLSFVGSAHEVGEARRLIAEAGGNARIVAKIEKRAALERIDEIIDAADAVMVARGDLGVEMPIEDVPGIQKMLIERCNRAARPVITATQMLESMTRNARPTRAEATDVANAILDGTDAVMLSAETAAGAHPVEAVRMMSRIAAAADGMLRHDVMASRLLCCGPMSPEQAVARSACETADEVGAAAIVTFTQSGATARLVARQRPAKPILALTPNETTYRALALLWGVRPLLTESVVSVEDVERAAVKIALDSGMARSGDRLVITAGHPILAKGNTNLIKIAVA